MIRPSWFAMAAFLQASSATPQAPPPAQPPAPATPTPNQAFSAALKDVAAHLQVEVPPEVDLVEEASLPVFASKPAPTAPARAKGGASISSEDGQTCRRQLIFVLQPKESLAFSLETVDFNKVYLHFGIPADPKHPLAAQLQRVKRTHPLIRAKGVTFSNDSAAPVEVVAVLSGYEKYPYKLKVQRTR